VAEALAEGDYDEEAQAAWDAQHEDEEEEEEEDEGEPPRVVSRPWDGKLLTKLKAKSLVHGYMKCVLACACCACAC
jgi:hypothetical protein